MATLDTYAESIGQAIDRGWPDADRIRLMAQAVEDFRRLSDDADREVFLREPQSTGDPVWDAAIAGLAVHLCRSAGMERTPSWTRDPSRFTQDFAWIGLAPDSDLRAYVFQRTPAYFKGRGVMLDAANLESV